MEEITPLQNPEITNTPHDTDQQATTPKRFKSSKTFVVAVSLLVLILVSVTSYLIYTNKTKKIDAPLQYNNQTSPVTSPTTESTGIKSNLTETKSLDTLNPTALIKVPFVRDGSIYLHEDGNEKLVAKPAQKTTQQACHNLTHPYLSPNGKYLAYIEQIGEQPGYGGCLGGSLRIVDISTGINKPTNYKTGYFSWTSANMINFAPDREVSQTPQKYTVKNIYYDPNTQNETVFETVIDQDKNTWANTMLSAEYPSDNLNKLIRFKNNKYYVVDNNSNKETLLFDKNQATSFLDWSPNGRYAILESTKESTEAFDTTELVVDTQNLNATPQEINVGRGGAGGDFSTGRKWYFDKGFVVYCRQDLYFVDGSKPIELTNDGGGGCHNEEGFVATSPNGQYAFIKFKNRFEIHTIDGNKTVIKETTPLSKGRGAPKNLIWLNDDYMVIFESIYGGYSSTDVKPKVHLFDRKTNTIKPLIDNAYLIDTLN
jgi:hypothetical protein